MASARARCETHAPFSTKRSAASACFSSSRVISRTRTLVSIARIALLHVRSDACFELIEIFLDRDAASENGFVNVQRRKLTGAAHDNIFSLLLPFQDRSG